MRGCNFVLFYPLIHDLNRLDLSLMLFFRIFAHGKFANGPFSVAKKDSNFRQLNASINNPLKGGGAKVASWVLPDKEGRVGNWKPLSWLRNITKEFVANRLFFFSIHHHIYFSHQRSLEKIKKERWLLTYGRKERSFVLFAQLRRKFRVCGGIQRRKHTSFHNPK